LHGAFSDGRHLGSGKRTPFTRPPRNRSWRPPSHGVGLAKSGPAPTSEEEATGVSETIVTVSHEGRERPRVTLVRSSKWGSRCEPRFSPVSFASGGPSCPVPVPQVSGRAKRQREKWTFRVNEHEPRGSVRVRFPRKVAERHSRADQGSQRWETAKQRVLELDCFGVQKSVGRTLVRDARGRYPAHTDTRGLARTSRTRRSDAQATTDLG